MTSWHDRNRITARLGLPRTSAAALLAGLLLTGLTGALPACGDPRPDPSAPAIAVTDRAGRGVRLAEPARRIVSLVPSATDWLIALGAADRVVVRTDHDQDPVLANVPSAGGGLTPSVEWIAARRPDLVLAWGDGPTRGTVGRLEEMGIPVYVATTETIDGALAVAADLGRLLGLEAITDSAVAAVRAGLDSVRTRWERPGPSPSVLFLIGLDPVTGAGPGTFIDELVGTAGGRNVLADLDHSWPPLALEAVLQRDPDVILVGTPAASPLDLVRHRPGWRSLSAVRAGRVHGVDPHVAGRWGPQLPAVADTLARLIHGCGR